MRTPTIAAPLILALTALASTLLAQEQSANPLPAERLMPLEQRHMSYRLTLNDEDQQANATLAPHPSRENTWWLRVGSHRHSLLKRTEAGRIVVLRQKLPDRGMTLTYDPPMLLLPAECKPGETIETTGSIRLEDREGDVHEGELTHTVKVHGRVNTQIDGETHRAIHVETVDRVDLGIVEIHITAHTHYVPGLGRAYQKMTTTRQTLKLFSETTTESFRVRQWRTAKNQ